MQRRRHTELAAVVARAQTTATDTTQNSDRPIGVERSSSYAERKTTTTLPITTLRSNELRRKNTTTKNSTPPYSSNRKRPLHPLGLPSLDGGNTPLDLDNSPQHMLHHRHYNPNTKSHTSRIPSSLTKVSPSDEDDSADSNIYLTAQKTAQQCVDHASKRQAAAKAALQSTVQISSSLKHIMGDSNKALSAARQSKIDAEQAASRAEEAARKVKEASDLTEKDKQLAFLELDEANEQAEQAWEFLRRVQGTSPLKRQHNKTDYSNIKVKRNEDTAPSARIGTVVEISESTKKQKSDYKNVSRERRSSHVHWKNESSNTQKVPTSIDTSSTKQGSLMIQPTQKYKGHASPITQIAAIGQNTFISSSWDTTIRMWNANTGECIRIFRGHKDWVHAISVLDNNKHFISGSDDRTVKLWNIDNDDCIRTFTGHTSFVKTVAPMGTDGERFISGGRDRTIKLFSVSSGECIQSFTGHTDVVSTLVSLDSSTFASGSHDNSIKYWNDSSTSCVRTLLGHTGSIKALASVSNKKEIISSSDDKTIRLWNVLSGSCIREFGSTNVNALVFSISYICEGFFLSCSGNSINMYNIPTGACVKTYETPRISLAVARLDDERFVTGSDQMLYLYKF